MSREPSLAPTWLWRASVGALAAVFAIGLGLIAAFQLGWRSPTPRRPPDWTLFAADWSWSGDEGMLAPETDQAVRLTRPDTQAWATAGRQLADGEIALRVRLGSPVEDVGVGLLFRYQNAANHYRFLVGGDGYYTVARVRDGELTPVQPWQEWPHVRRGAAVNRLRVRCDGPTCRFFINDEFTAEATDLTFLAGDVGVWAETFSDPALDAVFEELRVWQRDEGPKTQDEYLISNIPTLAPSGERW